MKNELRISKPNNRPTSILMLLLRWLTNLELSGGSGGEQDVGELIRVPIFESSLKRGKEMKDQNVKKFEMKTKYPILKGLALVLLMLTFSIGAMAQVGSLDKTGAQTVCVGSTESYGVVPNTGSTYSWTITPSSGGTISGTTNVIDVSWINIGNYEVSVVETNTTGCAGEPTTVTVTVNPLNTIVLSSAFGTDDQTVCIDSPVTNITYATTGATGATVTGLPTGITGSWATDVVTILGAPSVSGTFTYTVTTSGGCGVTTATGTITVTPANLIALSSAVGTDDQTVCIDSPVIDITYATTGATGATVTGLPTGVTGSWASNVFTILGTPSVSGTFTYTVTTIGGCGTATSTGTIDVTPANTIVLSSVAGTDGQTVCIDSPVTNITYATTGATNATITGLPTGVTGSWALDVVTILGAPSVSGTFTYTVTTIGGCGTATSTGTITVTPANTIALSSSTGTDGQTVCIDGPVTDITYATTGATGATVTGLPTGVTGSWTNEVVTILGSPSVSGTYTYTVTTSGGCGTATSTGSITVTPANTIALSSVTGTDGQSVCIDSPVTNITYATTGASDATIVGLPTGVTGSWASDVVTILGTPSVSGTFTYTVTTIGGCGVSTATGTITVKPNDTIVLSSASGTDGQTVCIDSPVTNITYATTGATNATVTGLPTGVTGSWTNDVFTILGTPSVSGTFTYTVTTSGGCGVATATGTITVIPLPIPVATANEPCVSGTLALTGAPDGMTSYSWTGPNGFTSTDQNPVITDVTAAAAGTYTLTITNSNGCSASITVVVKINPIPVTSPIYHN